MKNKNKETSSRDILEKYTNSSIHNVPKRMNEEDELVLDRDGHVKLIREVKEQEDKNTFEKY